MKSTKIVLEETSEESNLLFIKKQVLLFLKDKDLPLGIDDRNNLFEIVNDLKASLSSDQLSVLNDWINNVILRKN